MSGLELAADGIDFAQRVLDLVSQGSGDKRIIAQRDSTHDHTARKRAVRQDKPSDRHLWRSVGMYGEIDGNTVALALGKLKLKSQCVYPLGKTQDGREHHIGWPYGVPIIHIKAGPALARLLDFGVEGTDLRVNPYTEGRRREGIPLCIC